MLWANAGIIEARRNRMRFGDLAVVILKQIGFVAVQDARTAACKACGVFFFKTMTGRLNAKHFDVFVVQKRVEQANGV